MWAHLIDWCSLGTDGKKVVCARTRSTVKLGKAGWLHKLDDNGLKKHKKPHRRMSNQCINWEALQDLYRSKLLAQNAGFLASKLGLRTGHTLVKLGLGWDGEAYTFPAYDGEGQIVGIMRRFGDGKKIWVSRSRPGLFIPVMKSIEGNVFITEGLTDAAAMIDAGYRAVGRPSCNVGIAYIKRWLHEHKDIQQVTVVADNDKVGHQGAVELAHGLYGGKFAVAVLEVPEEYKDMRAWATEGKLTKKEIINRSHRL